MAIYSLASSQDRVPKEDTENYARLCVEGFGKPTDAPIETQGDPLKALAVRGEGGGAMVIPDKELNAEKLAKLGKEVVPVGQLWLRKWTPVVEGRPVPADRNRIVTVKLDEKDRPMPVLLMGMRKAEAGRELLLYAKDADPLLVLPLTAVEFVQEIPIELEWERGEKFIDRLTVTILGRYRAVVPVTRE
jgi:hypothetical protein